MRRGTATTLLAPAHAVAGSQRGASALALSLAKQALNRSVESDLASMLDAEATGQALAVTSEYHVEAVRRFVAKEPSLWQPVPPAA